MIAVPGMPDALAHDWKQLTALLEAMGERQTIPCRRSQVAHPDAWTSTDAQDQAVAASECQRCPAVDPCRQYGLRNPREVGVYGALTPAERVSSARRSTGGRK